MVLNLMISNILSLSPGLRCLKKTGNPNLQKTNRTRTIKKGAPKNRMATAPAISISLLSLSCTLSDKLYLGTSIDVPNTKEFIAKASSPTRYQNSFSFEKFHWQSTILTVSITRSCSPSVNCEPDGSHKIGRA